MVADLCASHAGERILVIGQYLDQPKRLAKQLGAPLLTGRTPNGKRSELYGAFRAGDVDVLILSKVGNSRSTSLTPPSPSRCRGRSAPEAGGGAASGSSAPPKSDGRDAVFYSVVTLGSKDQDFATKRQLFLTEQGYAYEIREDPRRSLTTEHPTCRPSPTRPIETLPSPRRRQAPGSDAMTPELLLREDRVTPTSPDPDRKIPSRSERRPSSPRIASRSDHGSDSSVATLLSRPRKPDLREPYRFWRGAEGPPLPSRVAEMRDQVARWMSDEDHVARCVGKLDAPARAVLDAFVRARAPSHRRGPGRRGVGGRGGALKRVALRRRRARWARVVPSSPLARLLECAWRPSPQGWRARSSEL